MTVDLLYLAGCPHHEATVELLQRVLEAEGMPAELRQILIRNHEDADVYGFPGSPTVRVNGQDIENMASHQLVGFACRTYVVEGKTQGVPPRSLVESAIRAAQRLEDRR